MKNNKIEIAAIANQTYQSMEFYRKVYNSMSDAERNELSIGLKTRGQYALEAYLAEKAKFEHYTNLLAV